jgi:TetR/AcrR family transcriptional regulator, regulator of autoinduction and epiphytic fitness
VSVIKQAAGLVEDSTYSSCMPVLIDAAERDPKVRAFHTSFSAERRAILVGLLRDGMEAGELPVSTNPELLADSLVGPIVLRRLMLAQWVSPAFAQEIVDQLLPTGHD